MQSSTTDKKGLNVSDFLRAFLVDKSLGDTSDIISDSSGVGTSTSDTTNPSITLPGTTVVCIESYNSGLPGHLSITQGDILEVTGATDDGYLEGNLRNQGTGLFPSHYVQEVRLRSNAAIPLAIQSHDMNTIGPQRSASGSRVQGRREVQKHFATAPRLKKILPAEPRTVVLHRARKGFGFVLRGAKASSPLMELTPNGRCPGLQYLDDVDKGGVADMAGLQKGDYLLAINGEDVSAASHEKVVELIRKSGDLVQMTVVSVGSPTGMQNSKSTANITGVPPGRGYATLPRKLTNGPLANTLGRSGAPLPPRRDPKTTLSVGRARAKSMVVTVNDEEEIENALNGSSIESIHQHEPGKKLVDLVEAQKKIGAGCDGSVSFLYRTGNSTNCQPRTASVRSRPISSRITATELEELFQRQRSLSQVSGLMTTSNFHNSSSSPASPAKTPRVYASVAEMKRSKSKVGGANTSRPDLQREEHLENEFNLNLFLKGSHKVRFFGSGSKSNMAEMHRDFHSTPDLAVPQFAMPNDMINGKPHRSQEDLGSLFRPLPPSHPPPPVPSMGQIVKVETRLSTSDQGGILVSKGEYVAAKAGKGKEGENGEVMSSFRPTDNAKLYASPEDIKTVGFRSRPAQVRKSQSLRSPTRGGFITDDSERPTTEPTQYAQPIRQTATARNHSSISDTVGTVKRHSLQMNRLTNPPPIPEPDYSFSESDEEVSQNNTANLTVISNNGSNMNNANKPILNNGNQEKETSGNSNSSASSSSTIGHSFSVEEIQKVRTKLKSSKSYPNDFMAQQNADGDGDNSSSGVSSDQDVPGGQLGQDEPELRIPAQPFQRQNSIRISNKTLLNKQKTLQLVTNPGGGRSAVSLAHLPPPIEDNADESGDGLVVPPPPEFLSGANTEMEVLAPPPPQFSDGKLVTRVRIVGAVPKTKATAAAMTGGKQKH
ncbi:hypothetical protein RUM44_002495 [Polyplax serrata]|uniref:Uncharacterized protein n=1 Tax=Polyplax serrata TaxID=468196 RepID=A0ABR1AEX8_POLSC